MKYLFRSYTVIEMIDQDTGEVVHREESRAKEVDNILKLMGYDEVSTVDVSITQSPEDNTLDLSHVDETIEEPTVLTDELSHDVEKVVVGDVTDTSVDDVDPIFSDLSLESDESSNNEATSEDDEDSDDVLILEGFDNEPLFTSDDADTDEPLDNAEPLVESDVDEVVDLDNTLPDYPDDSSDKVSDAASGYMSRMSSLDNLFGDS